MGRRLLRTGRWGLIKLKEIRKGWNIILQGKEGVREAETEG